MSERFRRIREKMVTHSSRIIYRKEKRNYTRVGYQIIGRKEVSKAERFRRIHEKRV